MAKIEYCERCGYIKQQCECDKPMTNADRIRSMTDEELAEFLCDYDACQMCPNSKDNTCSIMNCDEIGITERWLKSEVWCE